MAQTREYATMADVDIFSDEMVKYTKVWSNRDYGVQSDGEPLVELAYQTMGCKPGDSLVDWGCGCGRPAAKFAEMGLNVIGIDIAYNSRDQAVRKKFGFLQGCLFDPYVHEHYNLTADFAFCTDVLEHIPPIKLGYVLDKLAENTRKKAFIQVCVLPDTYGKKMSPPEELHLSVCAPDVWFAMLQRRWPTVEQLTLGGRARRAFVCSK
jgi:hypothetical protein